MLESLERVFFLLQSCKFSALSAYPCHLNHVGLENGLAQAQTVPIPQWLEMSIRDPSCSDKFAFTVVYDIICELSVTIFGRYAHPLCPL